MLNQRLYDIVQTSSKRLGIETKDVKKRYNWKQERDAFIGRVTEPMIMLKDFGFTDSEVKAFIKGAEESLDSVIFFYLVKKMVKESKDSEEFQEKIVTEWHSPKLLDYLNDISDIILDDFFIRKGGICFTS